MGRPRKYEEVGAKKIVGGGWTCDDCLFRNNNCRSMRSYMIEHGYSDCQEKPIVYQLKAK